MTKEKMKAAVWLSKQKYQTERCEQEYKMYFDVDMPKILTDYSASLMKENEELKAKVKEMEEKEIWTDNQDESL